MQRASRASGASRASKESDHALETLEQVERARTFTRSRLPSYSFALFVLGILYLAGWLADVLFASAAPVAATWLIGAVLAWSVILAHAFRREGEAGVAGNSVPLAVAAAAVGTIAFLLGAFRVGPAGLPVAWLAVSAGYLVLALIEGALGFAALMVALAGSVVSLWLLGADPAWSSLLYGGALFALGLVGIRRGGGPR